MSRNQTHLVKSLQGRRIFSSDNRELPTRERGGSISPFHLCMVAG